jgi:hypothetical protein
LKYVEDLLESFTDAYTGKRLPAPILTKRSKDILKLAEECPDRFTEDGDQELLDELYGFCKWASLVYPIARVDPRLFGAERRALRGLELVMHGHAPLGGWTD